MNAFGASKNPFIFIIDFEKQHSIVCHPQQINRQQLLYDFKGYTNTRHLKPLAHLLTLQPCPIPYEEYLKSFDMVKNQIQRGNSYLVNLTFETPLESCHTIKELFYHARAKYKLLYDQNFLVFSPETFITIHQGVISSFPMKGTIDASVKNAAKIILSDHKETAEHATIVDLIRNDLSTVAKNVRVEQFRYLDKIITQNKTLLQVSSKITGDLPAGYQSIIGDLLFSLLPAGSISGAPKNKTLEIIKQSENHLRGFYTGICGYFDGESLDCGVMIRFIQQRNNQLYFKSGGGITNYSDPILEYQEYVDKIYVPVA